MHRRHEFRAAPDSVNKMRDLVEKGESDFKLGQVTGCMARAASSRSVTRQGADGDARACRATRMLPFFGLTMKLGPIAEWGLNLHENLIPVDTAKFETIDAGHLRHRRHQHLSGQAEADPVGLPRGGADGAGRRTAYRLARARSCVFQYTTSSSSLQKKLGVK